MRAYFTTPIGYIFSALLMAVSAWFFMSYTLQRGASSNYSTYFQMIIILFIAIIPLLTMKLMSEERKLKTEQLLLTSRFAFRHCNIEISCRAQRFRRNVYSRFCYILHSSLPLRKSQRIDLFQLCSCYATGGIRIYIDRYICFISHGKSVHSRFRYDGFYNPSCSYKQP